MLKNYSIIFDIITTEVFFNFTIDVSIFATNQWLGKYMKYLNFSLITLIQKIPNNERLKRNNANKLHKVDRLEMIAAAAGAELGRFL